MSGLTIARTTSMRRRTVNLVMLGMTAVCAVLTLAALFFILAYLVYKGGSSVNVAFFTHLPAPVGEAGGGMANALLGSAKLLALAAVIGIPLGIMSGVYIAEFARPAAAFALRYLTDLLNGVPSIVIGIVAYTIVVLPMRRFSTLAGGVALGVMLVPIVVRGTEEFMRAVPGSLREASRCGSQAVRSTFASKTAVRTSPGRPFASPRCAGASPSCCCSPVAAVVVRRSKRRSGR
jgi:phosphate transport system permease protein